MLPVILSVSVLALFFSQPHAFSGSSDALDANGVSLQDRVESLERILLTPFGLDSVVIPCSLIFDDSSLSGEQTAAEWTRVRCVQFAIAT